VVKEFLLMTTFFNIAWPNTSYINDKICSTCKLHIDNTNKIFEYSFEHQAYT